jgi:hypothetical protein
MTSSPFYRQAHWGLKRWSKLPRPNGLFAQELGLSPVLCDFALHVLPPACCRLTWHPECLFHLCGPHLDWESQSQSLWAGKPGIRWAWDSKSLCPSPSRAGELGSSPHLSLGHCISWSSLEREPTRGVCVHTDHTTVGLVSPRICRVS